MKRSLGVSASLVALCSFIVLWGGTAASGYPGLFEDDEDSCGLVRTARLQGRVGRHEPHRVSAGGPAQSGRAGSTTAPRTTRSRKATSGGDIRVNQDFSCLPQDETAHRPEPASSKNYVAGANDYRLGWGTSGFYSTTDNGNHWYDGITPFPSLPSGDNLDGGGDPVTVFDRDGVAYYAQINFNRTDDTSGVWVNRSTNGGFTWTRPCVAIGVGPRRGASAAGRVTFAPARRRHGRLHPGQRRRPQRQCARPTTRSGSRPGRGRRA